MPWNVDEALKERAEESDKAIEQLITLTQTQERNETETSNNAVRKIAQGGNRTIRESENETYKKELD